MLGAPTSRSLLSALLQMAPGIFVNKMTINVQKRVGWAQPILRMADHAQFREKAALYAKECIFV